MKQETEEWFIEKFPQLFQECKLSAMESCMGRGLEICDGWGGLLLDLCEKIQKHCDETGNKDFRFTQVKEKFGELRVYTSYADDEIYNFISEAERKSLETCEITGKPGKPRNTGGWYVTLCDEEYEKRMKEREE